MCTFKLTPCFFHADSVKNKGGRVFVHCQAGISRSATICLAYLMRTNRVKLDEAFEFVKQRRSIISPNFSFMGQLLQFESQVLATSTCSSEASSPALSKSGTVFNFPVSIPVHAGASPLSFLSHHSPITSSPTCWQDLLLSLRQFMEGFRHPGHLKISSNKRPWWLYLSKRL